MKRKVLREFLYYLIFVGVVAALAWLLPLAEEQIFGQKGPFTVLLLLISIPGVISALIFIWLFGSESTARGGDAGKDLLNADYVFYGGYAIGALLSLAVIWACIRLSFLYIRRKYPEIRVVDLIKRLSREVPYFLLFVGAVMLPLAILALIDNYMWGVGVFGGEGFRAEGESPIMVFLSVISTPFWYPAILISSAVEGNAHGTESYSLFYGIVAVEVLIFLAVIWAIVRGIYNGN